MRKALTRAVFLILLASASTFAVDKATKAPAAPRPPKTATIPARTTSIASEHAMRFQCLRASMSLNAKTANSALSTDSPFILRAVYLSAVHS